MPINDFKIGDDVIITGDGNKDVWVHQMNITIGKTGKICQIDGSMMENQNLICVKFDKDQWFYYPENLKLYNILPEELFTI